MAVSPRVRVIRRALVLALIGSALFFTVGYADDGTPPPEPEPTEAALVEGTGELAGDQATEGELAADETITIGLGDLAPSSENLVIENSESASVFIDTEIVILDETGAPLAMASEEAAETLQRGDPIWCPASVSVPKPNLNGCTGSFTSLEMLFDDLVANPKSVDGTIWIAQDYSDTTDAILDGSLPALTTMRNFRLTLKGGWVGCGATPPSTCVGTVETTQPSEIAHTLAILDWNNDVSLSDILITGSTNLGDSLEIETTGKISLTRVEVSENDGSGTSLDNSAGTKDVVIVASSFNDNAGGHGLEIISRGQITLTDISAINNGGIGATLDNSGAAPTAKNVTLIGTNIFSENSGDGLVILSAGSVTASNLVNDSNSSIGAQLNNSFSTISSAVLVSGTSEFKFNGSGLSVTSKGAITLSNLTASYSQTGFGASITNLGSPIAANVTITGTNNFSENKTDGLAITSAGIITIYKTTANSNGVGGVEGYGVQVDNTSATIAKPVTFMGASTFNFNFENGVLVLSDGAISASALTAVDNGGKGVELNNSSASPLPQNITITGPIVTNLNGQEGLHIQSLGIISIGSVTSNENLMGGFISNSASATSKAVTISGTNSFSGNDNAGMQIQSKGTITLNNVTASNNLGSGAELEVTAGFAGNVNLTGTGDFSGNAGTGLKITGFGNIQIANLTGIENGGYGVLLDNAEPGAAGNVILGTTLANWCNEFSGNAISGIEITSNGTVTLTNVCASENGSIVFPGYGAVIDNSTSTGPKFVRINGTNLFSDNYAGGIEIISKGSITVNNLTALNNIHGFGAGLNNLSSGIGSPQAISLTGTNQFSGNYGNGLTIKTYGAITGNNVIASNNGINSGTGYGAAFDNCNEGISGCTTIPAYGIQLNGKNSFSSNKDQGLVIDSFGSILLSNVTASGNGSLGADINNDFPGSKGNLTITGSAIFSDNGANGLLGTSRGVIGITKLDASRNLGYGAALSNLNAPSSFGITLKGSLASENGGYGLLVNSLGAITVSDLVANTNVSYGVHLDNSTSAANGLVTLSGLQTILGNGGTGLEIESRRSISVNNLRSSQNAGYGALIENYGVGLAYDVKLSGMNIVEENNLSGLEIVTLGTVSINSISASANGQSSVIGDGYGVFVDNTGMSKAVTFTGTHSFVGNFEDGLHLNSQGQIKIGSISANSNGANGVSIDNQTGPSTSTVVFTGTNTFTENADLGLFVVSNSAITLSNLVAEFNDLGGVQLDNSASSSAAAVSLTGTSSFNNNALLVADSYGLLVKSRGAISISNVTANGNGFIGVRLNNKDYAAVDSFPAVTLTGINTFLNNGSFGLDIYAAGEVSLTKIIADGNVGDGVSVISNKNVTITCGSMTSNQGLGLNVVTNSVVPGIITLKGVFAYGNFAPNMQLVGASTIMVRSCPIP